MAKMNYGTYKGHSAYCGHHVSGQPTIMLGLTITDGLAPLVGKDVRLMMTLTEAHNALCSIQHWLNKYGSPSQAHPNPNKPAPVLLSPRSLYHVRIRPDNGPPQEHRLYWQPQGDSGQFTTDAQGIKDGIRWDDALDIWT